MQTKTHHPSNHLQEKGVRVAEQLADRYLVEARARAQERGDAARELRLGRDDGGGAAACRRRCSSIAAATRSSGGVASGSASRSGGGVADHGQQAVGLKELEALFVVEVEVVGGEQRARLGGLLEERRLGRG